MKTTAAAPRELLSADEVVPAALRQYLRWDYRHDATAKRVRNEFGLVLPRDRELIRQLAFVRVEQGGLRDFGLRCVGITPNKEETIMDMRDYASKYIKPDNVRDGPIQTRVVNVFEGGQYGRPVLELETGSQFTLNEGNCSALIKAWGYDSDSWIGQEVELTLGHYEDWKTNPPVEKETVKVRAISSANTAAANGGTAALTKPPLPASKVTTSLAQDLDDDLPSEGDRS